MFRRRPGQDKGATAVEYGLILAAIAAAVAVAAFSLGQLVQDSYSKSCSRIATPVRGACSQP